MSYPTLFELKYEIFPKILIWVTNVYPDLKTFSNIHFYLWVLNSFMKLIYILKS